MANSFATRNGTIIAQKTLTTLLAEFPALSKISTNFTDQPLLFGQSLKVDIVTARTAIAYSTTNGYVPSDAAITQATVTLNTHVHDTYYVNDQDATSTNVNLVNRFARASAYAIGSKVMADLMALVLNANYANSSTVAIGSFDRAALIDVNTQLDLRSVSSMDRFALLYPSYYGALLKDTTAVSNNTNPESNAIASGVLSDIDGTMVMRTSTVPGNSENLTGFVAVPEALAMATTIPAAPPEGIPLAGIANTVTDPDSGLSVQVREWYDFNLGRHYRNTVLMYGVAVGNAAALQRIKSA